MRHTIEQVTHASNLSAEPPFELQNISAKFLLALDNQSISIHDELGIIAQITRRQSAPIATLLNPHGAIQASQLTTVGQAGVGGRKVCVFVCVEPCGVATSKVSDPIATFPDDPYGAIQVLHKNTILEQKGMRQRNSSKKQETSVHSLEHSLSDEQGETAHKRYKVSSFNRVYPQSRAVVDPHIGLEKPTCQCRCTPSDSPILCYASITHRHEFSHSCQ
jgi:hypothetical protein